MAVKLITSAIGWTTHYLPGRTTFASRVSATFRTGQGCLATTLVILTLNEVNGKNLGHSLPLRVTKQSTFMGNPKVAIENFIRKNFIGVTFCPDFPHTWCGCSPFLDTSKNFTSARGNSYYSPSLLIKLKIYSKEKLSPLNLSGKKRVS